MMDEQAPHLQVGAGLRRTEHSSSSPHGRAERSEFTSNQWLLVWHAFKRHRLAMVGGVVILVMYILALFAEFFAANDPTFRDIDSPFAPPMRITVRTEGKWHLPSVYTMENVRDPETLLMKYAEVTERRHPIRLFVRGDSYSLWGVFPGNLHFVGIQGEQRLYLFGTDQMGRDILSRMVMGARLSMSIGLAGVSVSFVLAIVMGSLSGFFPGVVDIVIQRFIEVLSSIPTLPLYMSLAVAIPLNWSIVQVFFVITLILSLMGWPGLAREIRGKILALRETEYVIAARLDNAKTSWLLSRHLVPAVMSHLIASVTLAIPGMILGETALSYLGIGLREPAISWGVMLQDAQNIQRVITSPWYMLPVLPIIFAILSFNFLGDGLRDAADPYKS